MDSFGSKGSPAMQYLKQRYNYLFGSTKGLVLVAIAVSVVAIEVFLNSTSLHAGWR